MISGQIPYSNCSQFISSGSSIESSSLTATCGEGTNLQCKCCKCIGLLTIDNEILDCPSHEITVKFSSGQHDSVSLAIENKAQDTILQITESISKNEIYTETVCASNTDCYGLTAISYTSSATIELYFDDKVLIHNSNSYFFDFFGYSSTQKSITDGSCDNYEICGMDLTIGSLQRKALNIITKFANTSHLEDPLSPQHAAICWLLNDIIEDKNIEEFYLIQRYALCVIYFSTNGRDWENSTNWVSHENQCRW